ncbi:unnamed protein product [Rangifer tarandus platyrhynchus]|uniref:Uncharacterized protein n=1 Tax=Rangifer tarandus platyrhynchus TaxID=3082113 RepID=A0ABN8XN82_RANTA|nr:unnamed protein product [Rangifer tarandus platyrhynchus]
MCWACLRARGVTRVPPFVEGVTLKDGRYVETFRLPTISVGVSQSPPPPPSLSSSSSFPAAAVLYLDRCCGSGSYFYEGPPVLQYRGLPHSLQGNNRSAVFHHVHLSDAAREEITQYQQQLLLLRQQQQQQQQQEGEDEEQQQQGEQFLVEEKALRGEKDQRSQRGEGEEEAKQKKGEKKAEEEDREKEEKEEDEDEQQQQQLGNAEAGTEEQEK